MFNIGHTMAALLFTYAAFHSNSICFAFELHRSDFLEMRVRVYIQWEIPNQHKWSTDSLTHAQSSNFQ